MIFSIFLLFFPLVGGFLVSMLSDASKYTELILPSFAPNSSLFPIAWSILYLLMGYASYRIAKTEQSEYALYIYFIQLFINFIWSFLFFNLDLYVLSSLWILLLIIFVTATFFLFYKIDILASYLLVPYLLWIIFAFILNITISFLN